MIPDHSVTGDTLMIYGVITTPNLQSSNTAYFVQDSSAGIEVFSYGLPTINYSMGDSVFVIGTVAQYHGLTEFTPLAADSNHFGIIKHNAVMPKALRVSLHEYVTNAEKYEGLIIEVDSLFKVSGTWPAASKGASIYLTGLSKEDTLQMYINGGTNVGGTTEPEYPVDIVGVGSQYSSSTSVLNDGYEIIPRDSNDIKHNTVLGTETDQNIAYTFNLYQNYPNPFNPSTVIRFSLPMTEKVELTVFDILGRKVKTLYNGMAPQGITSVNFNAENLASGVYIYTIRTSKSVISKKLMLLK